MKYINLIIFLTFLSSQLYSQDKVEEYVQEGITFHDKGEYDMAIGAYKKALKLDPNSSLVNYELALSYFSKKEYEQAIKYSDKVLEIDNEFLLQAYLTKGSALDVIGKTNESIKLFEEAIQKTEGHYLLDYNLALNYYKTNTYDKAEANVLNAIQKNTNHSSSHLMLTNIHHQIGNKIQTLLAANYFLFLEPNTERSIQVLAILHENLKKGVSKDPEKENTINISITQGESGRFSAAELMVSMLEASNSTEENKGKSDEEMFEENIKTFFGILGEINKAEYNDIWDFYIPFFHDLSKSNNIQTYCKYITQAGNEKSKMWLENNIDKLEQFDEWLQNK